MFASGFNDRIAEPFNDSKLRAYCFMIDKEAAA